MQQKRGRVGGETSEIDIDKLIEEGLQKAAHLKEEAEKQAGNFKAQGQAFDLTLQTIDCFQFMDADYRDNKELMRELIEQELEKKRSNAIEERQGKPQRRHAATRGYNDQYEYDEPPPRWN